MIRTILLRVAPCDDVGATLRASTITGYKNSYLSTHPLRFLEAIVSHL